MTIKKPLRYTAKKADVFAFFGGANATARAFGVSSGAVAQWGDLIPEIRARQLEEVTDGKLKPEIQEAA
jgi:DNA-binding transcriptional regulator YdaS (Cro superfamily)